MDNNYKIEAAKEKALQNPLIMGCKRTKMKAINPKSISKEEL